MKKLSVTLLTMLWLAGCSTVSQQAREEAMPQMPFRELVQQAGQNIGETVIVGGYVVSVKNLPDRSELTAVQAPLGVGQEPQSKDKSEGRLILVSDTFLDPEVYTNGRKITAAGKLLGSSATEKTGEPYPYLRIKVNELHLFAVQKPLPPDSYFYDPWWYPYHYPYPYWWRHPYYW